MALRALSLAFASVVLALVVTCTFSAGPPAAPWGMGRVSEARALSSGLEANFTEGGTFNGTCQPFTETVHLVASASGGVPPYRFTWDFGPSSSLSYGPDVNHTYAAIGTYNVTLTVLDSTKDTVSVTQPVSVPGPPGCYFELGNGPQTPPWAFYALFGGTILGLALLGLAVWYRRE
jgi:hypothetical protein